MIELDRHIEILLLSNDCVIVPGLGGFMTHHVGARYDDNDQMYLPPLRTLGFNPQLTMNDSLLVQSYIEAYDISYPEALRRIESEVEELKQHISAAGYYELNDIGELALNEEGKYIFTPCEAGILTPELYGLSSFEISPLEETATVAETQTETEEKETPVLVGLTPDNDDDEERAAEDALKKLTAFGVALPGADQDGQACQHEAGAEDVVYDLLGDVLSDDQENTQREEKDPLDITDILVE